MPAGIFRLHAAGSSLFLDLIPVVGRSTINCQGYFLTAKQETTKSEVPAGIVRILFKFHMQQPSKG